jgi:serine/threonine-protein kinase RsbW
MIHRLHLAVTNPHEDLATLVREANRFARRHHVGVGLRRDLHVVLDEIVSNIVRYGYRHDGPYDIRVHLRVHPGGITIRITDDAPPFDPLAAPPVDPTSPLADRPVGGLGLRLVRHLMDSVQYCRHQGRNVLVLKKRAGARPARPRTRRTRP